MKRYSAIVIGLTTLAAAASAGFMWYAQPIAGDITRTGAFLERDYGWNQPQQAIPKTTRSDAEIGKPRMWVIGDSFSEAGFWQAYLHEQYTFDFTHLNHINRKRILARLDDPARKPDVLVLEIGERGMPDFFDAPTKNFGKAASCDALDNATADNVDVAALQHQINQLPDFPLKERATTLTQVNQISQGLHYAKLHLDILRKPSKRKGTAFALTRNDLMSHRQSDHLLVYYADLLMKDYPADTSIQTIQCNIEKLAAELRERNIPFVIAAVADKSSVYAPYLSDERFKREPLLSRLDLQRIPEAINLLPTKREFVAAGTVDVYLPNDTHWGHAGYQITAASIQMALAKQINTALRNDTETAP